MNNWFNVKVKYTKQLESGTFKRVSEQYLFAAMSFTDAESRAFEELGSSIRGEFTVLAITRAEFHDIFGYDDTDVWYQVKAQYQSMDDDSGKSKNILNKFLVGANNIDEATSNIKESLSTMMVDFQVVSVVESSIMDVYPYQENLNKEISRVSIETVEE
jgi:hypothetical protein